MDKSLLYNRYGDDGNIHESFGIMESFNTISDDTITQTEEDRENRLDCSGLAINCFLCKQLFTDIDELQNHLLCHFQENSNSHITRKYLSCDVCGRSIASEQELDNHHRRYHATHLLKKEIEAGKRFKCEKCGDVYISLDFLRKHMKIMHSSKKTAKALKRSISKPEKPRLITRIVPQTKQKYPPRSQFFNRNIWLDYDD